MSGERDLTGIVIDGRYRVERQLGAGGMGAVWRARHVQSLQHYALKTLHARSAGDRLAVDRFLREARAAAALQSKHVVTIVDANVTYVDPESGRAMPYIVMELLRGATLEAVLTWLGPLTPPQLIWLLEQVARALDLAHERGIIHRDLKPENIFIAIDEDGDTMAKVCDFGIAKMRGAAVQLIDTGAMKTEVGSTIGTPMYMAPEQARSSADAVAESDQWSLALMAYRALTGREYFSGALSTADLLLKIVNDPIVPPSTHHPALSSEFDGWFLRSCDRVPTRRWPSVGAQVVALREALQVRTPSPIAVVPNTESIEVAPTVRVEDSDAGSASTDAPSAATAGRSKTAARPWAGRRTWLAVGAAALCGAATLVLFVGRDARPDRPTSHSSGRSATAVPVVDAAPSTPPPPALSALAVASTPSALPGPSAVATLKKPTTKIAPVVSADGGAQAAPPEPSKTAPTKLEKGAPCERGVDCASGICAAYTCQ